MSWSEDRMHRWLQRQAAPACVGGRRGHDAAVIGATGLRSVQCADQCVEGVHFERNAKPKLVGRKVVLRALSDLAATGAQPVSVLLTIAAHGRVQERWLRAAIGGATEAAGEYGAGLVGGDLSLCDSGIVLAAFAHGTLDGKRKPPGRDRARPGQSVLLSGPVGGSLLGRHLRLKPPVETGQALYAAGASAMMDVSDGLAWDLHRLARASGVRIVLEHVPIHRDARRLARTTGRSPLEHALHDGEDHELIACIAQKHRPANMLPIGVVRKGQGLWLAPQLCEGNSISPSGRLWRPGEGGWKHAPSNPPKQEGPQ